MRTKAQDVEHQRIERVEWAIDEVTQDRVIGPQRPQRAINQLGRERRITSLEPAAGEQPWQHEIGVRILLAHGAQRVERDNADRVGRYARRTRRGWRGRLHENVSSGRRRAPRAQATAAIGALPSGWTVDNMTGVVAVPTSTASIPSRTTTTAPAASCATVPVRAGSTGPSLSRFARNVVQAPGAGVHARIRRSMCMAAADQSSWASAGVIFGAKLTPSR